MEDLSNTFILRGADEIDAEHIDYVLIVLLSHLDTLNSFFNRMVATRSINADSFAPI
jgi:hypothetical protein